MFASGVICFDRHQIVTYIFACRQTRSLRNYKVQAGDNGTETDCFDFLPVSTWFFAQNSFSAPLVSALF